VAVVTCHAGGEARKRDISRAQGATSTLVETARSIRCDHRHAQGRFQPWAICSRLARNHPALTQRNNAVRRLLIALALAFTPLPATGQGEPHAWLFGSWTGGTLPANPLATTQACYADPTVIFTRDIVLRTTLLDPTYTQRIIETVRATETGAEFRFRPMPRLPGVPAARQPTGTFGCASPDVLTVVRLGPNEIEFPGCTEFPSPLVRCPVP
jgi:hypothetical protein